MLSLPFEKICYLKIHFFLRLIRKCKGIITCCLFFSFLSIFLTLSILPKFVIYGKSESVFTIPQVDQPDKFENLSSTTNPRPKPPTDLRAIRLSDGVVKLWWDYSESEYPIKEYRIYLAKEGEAINYDKPITSISNNQQLWQSNPSKMKTIIAPLRWGGQVPPWKWFDKHILKPGQRYQFVVRAMYEYGIPDTNRNIIINPIFCNPYYWFKDHVNLVGNDIFSLCTDSTGIWAATHGGASHYNDLERKWETLTIREGIVNNMVYSTFYDSKKRLWFGTQGGLSCLLMNKAWITYTDEDVLPNNIVRVIFEDKTGKLWFGTDSGLCSYYNLSWEDYTEKNGLFRNQIKAICEDSVGNFWFGTTKGLIRFNCKDWKTFTTEHGLAHQEVLSLLCDSQGALWSGTYEGVCRFNKESETFTPEHVIKNEAVYTIYRDNNQSLWFGTSNGIYYFDGRNWISCKEKIGSDLSGYFVYTICQDDRGNLYFGTNRGLVPSYTPNSPYISKNTIAANEIQAIYKDRNGHLFFVTADGVNYYVNKELKEVLRDKKPLTDILTIIQDRHYNYWFGTNGNGVIRRQDDSVAIGKGKSVFKIRDENENSQMKGDKSKWHDYKSDAGDSVIYSIAEDNNGNLWFGTSHGIARCHYDGKNWVKYALMDNSSGSFVEVEIFNDSHKQCIVQIIIPQPDGTILFGTLGNGLHRYKNNKFEVIPIGKDAIRNNFIWSIFKDSDKRLWIGTANGVFCCHGNEWLENTCTEGLAHNIVVMIFEDKNKNLWFGTTNGLFMFDGKNLKPYNTDDGLVNNFVRTIAEDSEGNLWFGTNNGVSLLERQLNFPWRSFIFIVFFISIAVMTVNYYFRTSSATKARRIYNKFSTSEIYKAIYSQIFVKDKKEENSTEILSYLKDHYRKRNEVGAASVTEAFIRLNDLEIYDKSLSLAEIVRCMEIGTESESGEEIATLYNILNNMVEVKDVAQIAKLDLTITKISGIKFYGIDAKPIEIRQLPSFLDPELHIIFSRLEQVSASLRKCSAVDLQSKQVYLEDSLKEIEEIRNISDKLTRPEKISFMKITLRWHDIINSELEKISGQAELCANLLNKDPFFDEQVNLMLEICNAGQTVAENVVVSLLSSEDEFKMKKDSKYKFDLLAPNQIEKVEFSIKPSKRKRPNQLKFSLTWDDRKRKGNGYIHTEIIDLRDSPSTFKHIENPYITGNPVKSEKMFFGREDVIKFITTNLSGKFQDRTIILHGQRRTGKTSILYQLQNYRLKEEFIPVFIDVQGLALAIRNESDLLFRIASEIFEASEKKYIKLKKIREEEFNINPTKAFNLFLDNLEDCLKSKRIVLMFDEFEVIEEKASEGKIHKDLFGYIRSLMQHRNSLVFIFTGTHQLQELTEDYWSIFFNIAIHKKIDYLKSEDAEKLIEEPVKDNLKFEKLAVERIIGLTNGQPYFIQMICWELINLLNDEKKRNFCTSSDVTNIVNRIIASGEQNLVYVWNKASPEERLVLSTLAEELVPGKRYLLLSEVNRALSEKEINFSQNEISQILNQLCEQDILERVVVERDARYKFQVDLIGMWIRHNKPLQEVIPEVFPDKENLT